MDSYPYESIPPALLRDAVPFELPHGVFGSQLHTQRLSFKLKAGQFRQSLLCILLLSILDDSCLHGESCLVPVDVAVSNLPELFASFLNKEG